MLVLTRKLDETLRIGDDIKVTVLRVKGNTVRIGIEAPKSVRVVRDELERHEAVAADISAAEMPTADTASEATAATSQRAQGSRVFVGKVSAQGGRAELSEQPSGDQAAPLRAFLRNGRGLQVAG